MTSWGNDTFCFRVKNDWGKKMKKDIYDCLWGTKRFWRSWHMLTYTFKSSKYQATTTLWTLPSAARIAWRRSMASLKPRQFWRAAPESDETTTSWAWQKGACLAASVAVRLFDQRFCCYQKVATLALNHSQFPKCLDLMSGTSKARGLCERIVPHALRNKARCHGSLGKKPMQHVVDCPWDVLCPLPCGFPFRSCGCCGWVCQVSHSCALRQFGVWPQDAHNSFDQHESKLFPIACH